MRSTDNNNGHGSSINEKCSEDLMRLEMVLAAVANL